MERILSIVTKKNFVSVITIILCYYSDAQISSSYQWTWIGGETTVNSYGLYGQKGVENANNKPGARGYFYSWIDFNGNLWIFGGQGMAAGTGGNLNDLWRYNISTNAWTWMAGDSVPNRPAIQSGIGVEATANTPSARESGTFWSSGDGKELYLFGGFSPGLGWESYNDVWAYNVVSGKWRIVKAKMVDAGGNCTGQVYGSIDQFTPGVWPVCRWGATAASDGTKGYVFGGLPAAGSSLSDFLMFSDYNQYFPQNNQWASIVAPTMLPLISPAGQYTGSYPYPGGRETPNSFVYNNHFYLFGGGGYGALVNNTSVKGFLNDLWRYDGHDPLTQQAVWKWIGGDSTINGAGVYGVKGVQNLTNKPRARGHAMLKHANGNQFILFGGGSAEGDLNDLWSYDANGSTWTWLSGSSAPYAFANYGVKGVQSTSNMISGRIGTAMWVTANGDIYIFGGDTPYGKSNDFWKFSTPQDLISLDALNVTSVCTGGNIVVSYSIHPQASTPFNANNYFLVELSDASGQFNNPTAIGSSNSTLSGNITATIPPNIDAGSQYKIRVRSTAPQYFSKPFLSSIVITAPPKPIITTSGPTNLNCPTGAVTLTSSNAPAYQWSNGATSQNISVSDPGSYSVTITDDKGCKSLSAAAVVSCRNSSSVNAYITYGTTGANKGVKVINTKTNAVICTISTPFDYPDAVVVSADGSKAFVSYFDYSGGISVINTSADTITNNIIVGQGGLIGADGIDISPDGSKLYYAGLSKNFIKDTVFVINTTTGNVLAKVVLPSAGVEGIVASPDGAKVYVALGNTIHVINASTNTLSSAINIGSNAAIYGVAVSPDGTKLYAADYNQHRVTVISTSTNSIVANVTVSNSTSSEPFGMVVSPDGSKVYATNRQSNNVAVINASTNTLIGTIPAGQNPYGIALTPDGSRLFVANQTNPGTVNIINATTNAFVYSISTTAEAVAFGRFIGGPVVDTIRGIFQVTGANAPVIRGQFFNPLQDTMGTLYAEINPQNNNLGPTAWGANIYAGSDIRNKYGWFGKSYKEYGAFLRRNIFITPTSQPTSNNTIRIYCAKSDIDSFLNSFNTQYGTNKTINDIRIIKYEGANVDLDWNNNEDNSSKYTSVAPSTIDFYGFTNQFRFFEFPISSFSEFWLALVSPTKPLPLKLIAFTAVKQGNTALLNWRTASEQNTSHFDVERSMDGIQFTRINTINAFGNSLSLRNYSTIDANPIASQNFYRLKSVDKDGKYVYSETRVVNFENYNGVTLYPNPAKGAITLQLVTEQAESLKCSIVDASGRTILTKIITVIAGNNITQLDVHSLPTGVYAVFLKGTETSTELKFVKE